MSSLPAHIRTLDWLRHYGRGLPGVVIGSGATHLRGCARVPKDIDVFIPCTDAAIASWLARLRRHGWKIYAWRKPVGAAVSARCARRLFYLRGAYRDQQLDLCVRLSWARWGSVRRVVVHRRGLAVLAGRSLRC
jgi:hypothetical protein